MTIELYYIFIEHAITFVVDMTILLHIKGLYNKILLVDICCIFCTIVRKYNTLYMNTISF